MSIYSCSIATNPVSGASLNLVTFSTAPTKARAILSADGASDIRISLSVSGGSTFWEMKFPSFSGTREINLGDLAFWLPNAPLDLLVDTFGGTAGRVATTLILE